MEPRPVQTPPAPPLAQQVAAAKREIGAADQATTLIEAARRIPRLAGDTLSSGADALAVTSAISALNDAVTVRAVQLAAADTGSDLDRACWLAFGSQARAEQTLATDQDNGLVFVADDPDAERPRWMAFGERINRLLADCGYALCRGRVMASQPLCCLTADEWVRRFGHWMAHGSGNDLLAARIFFDLRPLAGNVALAAPLTALLKSPAAQVPRFVKQMADVVLCNHVPLNWRGAVRTTRHEGREMFDLKMSGSALFVDAARLWALAHGSGEVGTVSRFEAAAPRLHLPADELRSWLQGFATLQRLRLQTQQRRDPASDPDERSWASWDDLGPAQRDELRRALQASHWIQQRIVLDYRR